MKLWTTEHIKAYLGMKKQSWITVRFPRDVSQSPIFCYPLLTKWSRFLPVETMWLRLLLWIHRVWRWWWQAVSELRFSSYYEFSLAWFMFLFRESESMEKIPRHMNRTYGRMDWKVQGWVCVQISSSPDLCPSDAKWHR